MVPETKRVVVVASKQELSDEHYRKRLWLAARNLRISRRRWPDEIAAAIYNFHGDILLPSGLPWPVPDVDDVLGDPRWFSYYFEETNGQPRRDVRLIERLRMIDLYFRIARPLIQRHFAR